MPQSSKKVANKNKKPNAKKKGNRPLLVKGDIPDEHVEYGRVTKAWGSCMFQVTCYDRKGSELLCKLRGRLEKKKIRVNPNDVVLVGLRAFDDEKGDIIYVYTLPEVNALLRLKEIVVASEINAEETGFEIEHQEEDEDDAKANNNPHSVTIKAKPQHGQLVRFHDDLFDDESETDEDDADDTPATTFNKKKLNYVAIESDAPVEPFNFDEI